jgi:hypothetical protein
MATTTPNFGWAVPTSSDLVKNGATAIETLGDSIDASLVDLKGGTTGQVLKKATNTDMDFVWSADSAGMTNPMTTTGDTIYSSSGSTPARLGIGSSGQVLTVASGVPSWATPAGGGGKVLQVVSTTYSTLVTVASTTYTDTGLSLSITPTSATSKILVFINQATEVERSTIAAGSAIKILRGATTVFEQSGSGSQSSGAEIGGASSIVLDSVVAFTYLDSPATTSATTYKTQGKAFSTANSGVVRFQASSNAISTITLMEIGA